MKSPWRITGHAVRQYLAITGGDRVHRGLAFDRAQRELGEFAIESTTSNRTPKELDNGSIQYRGRLPLRLRFIVIPHRLSNELPVLVDVLPDHERRQKPYQRSAHPARKVTFK